MKTIKEVIEFLEMFPDDSIVYAYEGESVCIVVRSSNNKRELGYIDCSQPYTKGELNE